MPGARRPELPAPAPAPACAPGAPPPGPSLASPSSRWQSARRARCAFPCSVTPHGDTAPVSVTGLHESWQGGHRSQRSPAVWLGPRYGVPRGPRLSNPRVIGTVPPSGFPSREPPHPRASEPQSGGAWRTCTFPESSWWCRRCPPGATLCEPLPRASAKTGCWVAEWKRPGSAGNRQPAPKSSRTMRQCSRLHIPALGNAFAVFPRPPVSLLHQPELCRRGAWHTRGLG